MVYEVHGHFSSLRKAMSLFEPNYRGPGEGPRGPFQAFLNPSGTSPHKRVSGCPFQHQHFFQVVAYALQPHVTSVAHVTEIATSLQAIAAFQGVELIFTLGKFISRYFRRGLTLV